MIEVAANRQHGVSTFYKDVVATKKGIHVGVVCDTDGHYAAKMAIYQWARIKRNTNPCELIKNIFDGVM
jgi:hypothetical protein